MNDRDSIATRHPDLMWYSSGHCGFRGALRRLYDEVDRLFATWAAGCGADEHMFPPFIPAEALARLNYLESFPHLATFPVALEDDASNLRAFAGSNSAPGDGDVRLTRIAPPRDVLTPAACYHFYHNLQGTSVAHPRYLTTRTTCFRRERFYAPLERQWSFSMREIVCIGTAEEVGQFLMRMQGTVAAFFRVHGFPVEWRAATDPFFDPSRNARYLAQRLDPVKTEMVFADRLAIGSVNSHRNYFGEAFDIRRGGEPAFSGCVAFGVERWIYAWLSRFGPEPADWPLP